MGVYIYCLEQDYKYLSSLKGRGFENEWMKFEPSGMITIKGSNKKGYAWDGCSPKLKWRDICWIGTPDAVLNWKSMRPKTYYASMIHDIFYQFSNSLKLIVKRKEVDVMFYDILKENHFHFARVYYCVVRSLGWMFWGKRKR